uniref:Putative single-stranded DNA binding protein n=1 Tax=Hildenbrandia rubra TaxID=31481 RepID=A0A1C9CG22_9FLOR|nr:putative single-stranded DNA binding protein [Hildenbrandia rubra]AOM67333.1 putative single-stranded DNA binding protein [Hildenbrandia rubra]
MNQSFITGLISKKYNLFTNYSNEQLITKLALIIPSIDYEPVFYNIQACALGDTAKKISELCIPGEYLFLEGSAWTQIVITNNIKDEDTVSLLFMVSDMQPIF